MDELFLTISVAVVSGTSAPKTMCLMGQIQGVPVRILVDSESSHTFISEELAQKLSGSSQLPAPIKVKVANGNIIQFSFQIAAGAWSSNRYSFHSDMKVLPLSSYDMILGLDWLESFSPMKVHWKHKWLTVPYGDSTATLFGIMDEIPEGVVVQVCTVQTQISDSVELSIPPYVQMLIEQFADLFAMPTELPPPRDSDHRIPLVPGASPVVVRPYRFAPALKSELEKQIKEMLDSGVIQKSSSPFSSSVLLVNKKDSSWRFCVDYRHLNAITVKGKYPVPIIEEILDELAHASWFSCLDLRAGFHQIRFKPGEEYKTTFQTYCGHFDSG